jgi:hypothetical protein
MILKRPEKTQMGNRGRSYEVVVSCNKSQICHFWTHSMQETIALFDVLVNFMLILFLLPSL